MRIGEESAVRILALTLLCWPVIAAAGCGPSASSQPVESGPVTRAAWFADVSADWGLDFTHDPGPIDEEYFLPQINGSGAALFDFDNDGRLDIYLLQGGGDDSTARNALLHQLPSGRFENVSSGSGLDLNGTNTGLAIGDVDNDGWLDVLVTRYLGVKLLLNRGHGKFEDATERAGLSNPYWGASASFCDYDRDGWLDLVVVNYVEFEASRRCVTKGGKRDYCPPNQFQSAISRLFRNRGASESGSWRGFEDRTKPAGLASAPGPGLGVLCADFSGDGWPDLFVANDEQANHLWINQRNGTFQNEAVLRGVAYNAQGQTQANMGVAYGDVDGDGLSDLFVTLFMGQRHALWKQAPRGFFSEQGGAAGLSRARWHGTGWGTVLADFDQDGALDLALVNGFVQRHGALTESFWDPYKDRNQVFANDGAGLFQDIAADNPAFCGELNMGRGLCLGDIDGDGALDLLVTQVGGPARIFRNVAPQRGHWLMVRAVEPVLRRDAIGAEVRIEAGARRWYRLIQPGQSFQCSHDPRAHFGLGTVERVDFLEILWPDGSTERFPCPAVDRVVVVERGKGQPIAANEENRP